MKNKIILIIGGLCAALLAQATDIVPNPVSPGNLGSPTLPFPNIYGTSLHGALSGTNLLAGSVNSNALDAATKAMLGTGTGGSSFPLASNVNANTYSITNVGSLTATNIACVNGAMNINAGGGTVTAATIAGGGITGSAAQISGNVSATGIFSGNGSGLTNLSGVGGSQTPWTNDINAAAHNLTNVMKITGTIAFPFLYQPVDPLYGANLSWSIGADDSIPDFILDYNTNSTLLSRFEFTPEGGLTLTGGYSDNGGAYPGTNIFGLPTLLTNNNNTIAGVFYGNANLTNNTATPWNAGSTNDLATKSNVVSAVNALALGAISPGLGISTNGGVVAVTYPTLTNGGSGYSIAVSSMSVSNMLLTGTTAAALVPTMTGPNTPYGQVIDSGPFGAQPQYAGWYAFGGSNFHSYSTNMAWVEYVAPGYLTATGAVITISSGSSTNMVQVSNDGITFTTIYSNNICNNGTAFPFTSTTAQYWRFTFPNATTAPQEQIVNGLQLYGLAQAGIRMGTNGNVTIGANLNAGSVAASTFTGSFYGNGAGVTNQSVASFAVGGVSSSNSWFGAFTGNASGLTNYQRTNLLSSYTAWPGPTNTLNVGGGFQSYTMYSNACITNLTWTANDCFLRLSNAGASDYLFYYTGNGKAIGSVTTNSMTVKAGKTAGMWFTGDGASWTNYINAAQP